MFFFSVYGCAPSRTACVDSQAAGQMAASWFICQVQDTVMGLVVRVSSDLQSTDALHRQDVTLCKRRLCEEKKGVGQWSTPLSLTYMLRCKRLSPNELSMARMTEQQRASAAQTRHKKGHGSPGGATQVLQNRLDRHPSEFQAGIRLWQQHRGGHHGTGAHQTGCSGGCVGVVKLKVHGGGSGRGESWLT